MTIDEAIKILAILDHGDTAEIEDTWLDALKLGIEALKRIKGGRSWLFPRASDLLPGETKD